MQGWRGFPSSRLSGRRGALDTSHIVRGGLSGFQPLPALPHLPPQGFLSGRGWFGEGQEIGRGADVLNTLEQLVKGHMPTAKRPQVKYRAGCPGEVASPRPPTLTGLCSLSPGHWMQQQAARCTGSRTGSHYSVTRDQHSIHMPLKSAVPLWPQAQCVSALLCGAVGEPGFRHSPVTCGKTCGQENVLKQ